MTRKLLNYFGSGLLLVGPIYITLWIIMTGIQSLDSILPVYLTVEGSSKPVYFPGLGLLIIISLIILLGYVFSTIVPLSFFHLIERIVGRIPLVNIIYTSIKDLIGAFVGDRKKFNHPVMITVYKDSGIKKFGFITQQDLSYFNIQDHIAVYLPHAYAFSGQLVIVPKENIVILDASGADIMKMIVSGGVSMRDKVPGDKIETEQS
jgi:uncharacterized membrane protein